MYLLAAGATAKSEAEKVAMLITLGGAELMTIFNSYATTSKAKKYRW